MARMFPEDSPNFSQSPDAEPDLYWRLSRLPDDFTVIHSIPWIAAVVKELFPKSGITGEIDFLILHPELGMLALEVKGGHVQMHRGRFAYVKGKDQRPDYIDPVGQVRQGTHGLARWLGVDETLRFRIGYAIIFPDVEMPNNKLPPGLLDRTIHPPQRLVIDRPTVFKHFLPSILELMKYWKTRNPGNVPTPEMIDTIASLICPDADYGLTWTSRIDEDRVTWLQLTREQSRVLDHLIKEHRCVVEGRPGTGKTLLLITLARHVAEQEKRVLILVFNVALAEYLRDELRGSSIDIIHYHKLCSDAERKLGIRREKRNVFDELEWYQHEGPQALHDAIAQGKLTEYDALLVDEAQVFNHDRWQSLLLWFRNKRIVAFCDEAQVFTFEHRTTAGELAQLLGTPRPYLLTVNLRSPRKVFERLQYVLPTPYQLSSPRLEISDTLYEVATENPYETLQQVLATLQSEGIDRTHITLLYGKTPPTDTGSIKISQIIGRMERITRFRGLESPVIIVWAVGRLSEADLFCAFSRATSRCLIIYSIDDLIHEQLGRFGQAYLEEPSTPESIRMVIQSPWNYFNSFMVGKLNIEVELVINLSAHIVWCSTWCSWIVITSGIDDLSAILWTRHLCLSGDSPIYVWNSKDSAQIDLFYGGYRFGVDNSIESQRFSLRLCTSCSSYTRHVYVGGPRSEDQYTCLEHNQDLADEILIGLFPLYDYERSSHESYDTFIADHTQYTIDQKRQRMQDMDVFLLLLILTQKLDLTYRNILAVAATRDPAFMAARMLTAYDLILAQPGHVFDATEQSQKYMKWCPLLRQSIDDGLWRNYVARAFGYWIGTYQWAEKIKPGQYRRATELTLQSRSDRLAQERQEATRSNTIM